MSGTMAALLVALDALPDGNRVKEQALTVFRIGSFAQMRMVVQSCRDELARLHSVIDDKEQEEIEP